MYITIRLTLNQGLHSGNPSFKRGWGLQMLAKRMWFSVKMGGLKKGRVQ